MAEIESVLDHMVHRELQTASNHATRATIKLRVLLKLMDLLDVPLQWLYDTKNLIRVDVSCSREIENIWSTLFDKYPPTLESAASSGSSVTTPVQPTAEESALIEKFLAKDFVKSQDIGKLIAMLTKKYKAHRDIWYILAVDGLYPSQDMDDLKLYYDHFSIDIAKQSRNLSQNPEENSIRHLRQGHVRGVREIYSTMKEVNPTQIAQVLRKIFKIHDNSLRTSHHDLTSTSSVSSQQESKTIPEENSNQSVGHAIPCTPEDEFDEVSFSPVESIENNPMETDAPIEDDLKLKILENQIECCYRFAVPDKRTFRAIAAWKKKELEQCERMAEKRSKGNDKRKSAKKVKLTKPMEVPTNENESLTQNTENPVSVPEEVTKPSEPGVVETKIPKEKKKKTKEGLTTTTSLTAEPKQPSKVKDPTKKPHKSVKKVVTVEDK